MRLWRNHGVILALLMLIPAMSAICAQEKDTMTTTEPLAFDTRRGGGAFGPAIAIDPVFEYYAKRPWRETCAAVRAAGFTSAQIIDVGGAPVDHAAVAAAFREAGVSPILRIYPATDHKMYREHPEWRQRMLGGADGKFLWRTYLCPNRPDFVKAHCASIGKMMREGGYEGIQLAEIWFEKWGGPEEAPGKPNAFYACVCEACLGRFRDLTGEDAMPMLTLPSDPRYFRRPDNAALYAKWVGMRVQTIQDFGKALIDAAKRANPKVNVSVMYMADARVELDGGREYQGCDFDRMVGEWKPDILALEDAWQDWTQANLGVEFIADYAHAYRARVERLNPGTFIMTHADIGSLPESRRSREWIRSFAEATVRSGLGAPSFYEWSVSAFAQK
jgi:hypothetical protein